MKIKISLAIALSIILILCLSFFTQKENHELTVGVFLQSEHQIIDDIYKGFKEELISSAKDRNQKIIFIEKNANGDRLQMDMIANYFKSSNVDLIFAVGAPAIQTLKSQRCKKPIIMGGPPSAIELGVVDRYENHKTNFSGTTYSPPTSIILQVALSTFENLKTIAVLRNPSEANSASVAKSFIKIAREKGINVIDLPSMTGGEVDASLRTLGSSSVDALFIPTDNLLYSMLDRVISTTKKLNIPVFSCTELAVQKGALFSVGTDYKDVGKLSGRMAAKILFDNIPIEEMDVLEVNTGNIYINSSDSKSNEVAPIKGYSVKKVNHAN